MANESMAATTVRAASDHGTVTVFGVATLLVHGPPTQDGRMNIMLRYASRSLWLWLAKYPADVFTVDMWAPVLPPETRHQDRSPWLRSTVYRLRLDSNTHDRDSGVYVSAGWAERDPRSGEVLRFRQDVTSLSGEQPPGGDGK